MPPTEPAAEIVYALEPELSVEEFMDVLVRSTLAERRPMDKPDLLDQALRKATVIVTARDGSGTLVGVSRAISDFSLATYLADLAVDEAFQKRGIGRELIRRTHEAAGLHTWLILLAAPKARTYYPHIGMRPHDSCWVRDRVEPATNQEAIGE
jgi:GNAT superfamily N-acetyltransferase